MNRTIAIIASRRNLFTAVSLAGFAMVFLMAHRLAGNSRIGPLSNFTVHKIGHVVVYGGLAFLLCKGLRNRYPQAWAIGVALSTAEEIHQIYVPGRSASLRDVLINVATITTVILLTRLVQNRARFRSNAVV